MSRELFNGLFMTEHRKTGKMMNMDSFMFMHPPFCQDRKIGVCGKCYSKKLSGYRPFLAKRQAQNTLTLSNPDYQPTKFNTINGVIRWGSFGELSDPVMYQNICRTVNENPHLLHVLWTKRAGIIRTQKKPNCLKLVWSATKIDVKKPFVPKGFDMAFFVYSSEDKIPSGEYWDKKIHRCTMNCSKCMHCYSTYRAGIVAEVIR